MKNEPNRPAHRILLVEPKPDLGRLLAQVLEEQGYQAAVVANVAEATRLLEKQDASVVLADLCEYPGDAFISAVSRLSAVAGPARIGLATAAKSTEKDVLTQGFSFLLRKPFTAEEFLSTVGTHCAGAPDPIRKQVVDRYFAALSRRDWEGLGGLCTEDVQYHLPGTDPRFSRLVQGRRAVCAFAEQTFGDFPEANFVVEEQVVLPSAVIGRFRCKWKGSANQQTEATGAVLFHFDGELLSQIGVRLEVQRLLLEVPT